MGASKYIKRIILILGVLLFASAVTGGVLIAQSFNDQQKDTVAQDLPLEQTPYTPSDTTVRIVAMGDMLAHDTIIENARKDDSYDFGAYFKGIRNAYKDADLVVCNQEGLSSGEVYGITGYPSFNAPSQFAVGLQSGAGCNMINLANNHMGDKGVAATNKTLELWESLTPATITGANRSVDEQNQDIGYVTVKGIKIAMVSFADFNNNGATPAYSINLYHNEALVRKLVGEARQNADIVMVSMHWGTEDSAEINQDQRTQTTLLASLGVDVIIGTGPHVLQPVEVVDRPDGGAMTVWYSLGNMLSSQLQLKGLIGGIASFEITKIDNKAQVGALSFIPTYMHYDWTAEEAAASDLMARKNAKIYLLSEATTPLSNSLFDTTVEAQQKYVDETLGSVVKVQR